jgi:flagellar FliL protein
MSMIIGMVVLTGLSLGAGGMFGLTVLSKGTPPMPKAEQKAGDGPKLRYSEKATLHQLSPIVTNLASPEKAWIRLEASVVVEGEGIDVKALSATITEDTVAYLRTLSLPLIEGASGYLHLREDLNERVRVRTAGKIREMIVHTLIVE